METVIVIGAGASGMAAALTAAEKPGRHVVLLERQQRVGRKLMATGNGRCNLTNTGASPEHYHGEHPEFILPAMEKFPPEDNMHWFEKMGLLMTEEYGGRVYPLSQSANSVVDVLRCALDRSGVDLRPASPVRELKKSGNGFQVVTDGETLSADCVIIACGGAAGAKLGGVRDGYELLKPLGHKATKLYPALVQILTEPEYPRALKGVRADAAVAIRAGSEVLRQSSGELQFTETGISGPAAFDLSRLAASEGQGLTAEIDFLRDYSEETVCTMLEKRRDSFRDVPAQDFLTGILHNRLGRMVMKYAGVSAGKNSGELNAAELRAVAAACKHFCLKVTGTENFDSAQVTAGGIRTAGFNPETLESWFIPGLFACGELLDVDGDCGGFNLQWAWASGRLAGRLGE